MLESMLGPDTMKKIMVYMMGSAFIMLAFVGMVMIIYTSIVPTFHAHLWPALISVDCAGAWFVAKSKGLKMGLAGVAFLAGLWILLNSIIYGAFSNRCAPRHLWLSFRNYGSPEVIRLDKRLLFLNKKLSSIYAGGFFISTDRLYKGAHLDYRKGSSLSKLQP